MKNTTISRFLCTFLLLILGMQSVWPEQGFIEEGGNIKTENTASNAQQQVDVAFDTKALKKNYLVGILGMVTTNLVIMSWNKFVIGSGWAQVTWDGVWPPWERKVEFDTGWYWTNFVLHPYQGALYYMSARNANLNVLESFLITGVGSAMWEYFGELNNPSINDLVYSSVGGFIVGEMLYRLGLEAQNKSNILGFLFNPIRILTDPLTGHKPNGSIGNIHALSFKGGFNTAFTGTWFQREYDFSKEIFPFSGLIEAYVVYGDPYTHNSNVPYSQFELEMGGGVGVGSGFGIKPIEQKMMYDIHIFSNGMMFSRTVNWGENRNTSIGMVFDYDFMWHSFMEFSSIAPGFAIKQRVNYEKSKIEWQTHFCAILLGSSDCYYFRRGLKKPTDKGTFQDYGYSFGGQIVGKLRWIHDRHILNGDFHGFAMYKFPYQRQSNAMKGWEFFGLLDLSYEYFVSKNLSLGISNELYIKKSLYKSESNFFSVLNAPSIYVRYSF